MYGQEELDLAFAAEHLNPRDGDALTYSLERFRLVNFPFPHRWQYARTRYGLEVIFSCQLPDRRIFHTERRFDSTVVDREGMNSVFGQMRLMVRDAMIGIADETIRIDGKPVT